MELLAHASKGVLILLSAVGIALSAVLFNTYQDDTKRIQDLYSNITTQNNQMLLAQQASEFRFKELTLLIATRAKQMDDIEDTQTSLISRVDKLEFLWKLNNVKKLVASDIDGDASVMEADDISRIVSYLQ